MKRAAKTILYIFLSFLLVIVILVVIAAFSENKIARLALDQVSKTTNIPIQVEKIEFSLIHDFPFATLKCRNLKVSLPEYVDNFEQDTLAFVDELFISVDVKPLLKNVFNVRKVEVNNGRLFFLVDSTGVSNLDFLMDTTGQDMNDTLGNGLNLDIKDFSVNNAFLHYTDEKQKAKANLLINQLNLSGLIENEEYNGEAEGNVYLTNCSYDTTRLYLMNQASVDFSVNNNEGRLTVNHTNIAVDDDIQLSLHGFVNRGDTISTRMDIIAEKVDLGGLIKYVPENVLKEMGIWNISGILSTKATVSGLISDSIQPSITSDFDFSGGSLRYMDFPTLRNISLNGSATNGSQQNNKTTNIDIRSLKFQTTNSNFLVSGKLKNMDRPEFSLNSVFDLDLQETTAFIPDTLLQSLNGRIKAKISTKGIMPDSITTDFVQKLLANTKADLNLSNVNANMDSTLAVNQLNLQIDYQPNYMKIKEFSAEFPTYNLEVKNLNAAIHGNFTVPDSLQLKIDSLNAIIPSYKLEVKNLNAELAGDISNPESLDIKINKLLVESENNNIELSGTVKNPMAPDYSLSGKINLNLEEIRRYLPDSLVNSLAGNVSASFKSAAVLNLDSIGSQLYALIFEKSNFNLSLEEVSVEMPDSMMSVSNLSGQLKYNSDTLEIEQFEASYLGMEMGMNSVTATNLYSAAILNQSKQLNVNGNFNVDKLDYTMLAKWMEEDTTTISENDANPTNFTYKINGRFKTNSIKYEDAVFTNVNSKFLVKNNYYVLDSLQMEAFNGKTITSVKVELKENDEMDLYFKSDIAKMDVHKFMIAFEDVLDYEDFKAENVRGILTAKMDGRVLLKNYEPDYETMMLKGNLTLTNGALINVKPVMEVEKVPGVGLKNMDKLYFSALTSSLFLFNNELYIPITNIKSTSFDAGFLGMYSFGEDYDYHIRMFLGEVLTSKSKANLKKMALEGGFDEEETQDVDVTKGRTAIFLVSKSENGKEKAGFDKKRDRANMVAKVNLQKQMVDMRFHPALVKYNTEE